MRNSIKQYTRQYIEDNKIYIEDNIADYLITTAQQEENGYFWYLSQNEITEFEENTKKREKLIIEIENFIYKYFNFNINDFDY